MDIYCFSNYLLTLWCSKTLHLIKNSLCGIFNACVKTFKAKLQIVHPLSKKTYQWNNYLASRSNFSLNMIRYSSNHCRSMKCHFPLHLIRIITFCTAVYFFKYILFIKHLITMLPNFHEFICFRRSAFTNVETVSLMIVTIQLLNTQIA